ncbi:hypothetical protein G6F60_015379 [Rhizopus arrhizus]|nr:hypothetical protein G6F60_015379 [Rhizopus arrhizus]
MQPGPGAKRAGREHAGRGRAVRPAAAGGPGWQRGARGDVRVRWPAAAPRSGARSVRGSCRCCRRGD